MSTIAQAFSHNTPGKIDIAVESILLFLDLVAIGLRIWSRRIQRLKLQPNDWMIIAATVLMIGRFAVEILGVLICGLGLHVLEVAETGGPDVFIKFKQLAYADDLLWVTIVTLIKLSILELYITVFRRTTFIRIATGVMVLCVCFWIAAFLSTALFCIPPQKDWYTDMPGYCGNSDDLYSGVASTDLILDVFTIALPMPVLWSLQLPLPKKIALTFVFALGFVDIAITAVRIKFMLSLDPTDVTYSYSNIALLSAIVPLLGIINACLPVLAPAIRVMFNTTMFGGASATTNNFNSERYWSRKGLSRGSVRLDEDPDTPLVKMNQSSTAYASRVHKSSFNPDEHKIHVVSDFEVSPA